MTIPTLPPCAVSTCYSNDSESLTDCGQFCFCGLSSKFQVDTAHCSGKRPSPCQGHHGQWQSRLLCQTSLIRSYSVHYYRYMWLGGSMLPQMARAPTLVRAVSVSGSYWWLVRQELLYFGICSCSSPGPGGSKAINEDAPAFGICSCSSPRSMCLRGSRILESFGEPGKDRFR